MNNETLLKMAYEATERSYAPYSKFKVGAALLTEEGKVFTGCNIECASFGGTNCAERTAIFKAISEGYNKFVKIAVVSAGEIFTYPCGICRQVLNEFAPDIDIVLDDHGDVKVINLKEMLPYSFGPSDLR
ncbi:cytidine deaminase [Acidaminobacter sp. JC074]|uniref:cytidine deaminase n=1 Tax=Acidaminobacter sp. JC074 TaxID=2530199 RepID=UPI001F0DE041|nr:cytidine deaminase [Acidaminobacter sp. JC074]MCH4887713.1 cytidine deaminase [Acidaminobacter sp. JC074]